MLITLQTLKFRGSSLMNSSLVGNFDIVECYDRSNWQIISLVLIVIGFKIAVCLGLSIGAPNRVQFWGIIRRLSSESSYRLFKLDSFGSSETFYSKADLQAFPCRDHSLWWCSGDALWHLTRNQKARTMGWSQLEDHKFSFRIRPTVRDQRRFSRSQVNDGLSVSNSQWEALGEKLSARSFQLGAHQMRMMKRTHLLLKIRDLFVKSKCSTA